MFRNIETHEDFRQALEFVNAIDEYLPRSDSATALQEYERDGTLDNRSVKLLPTPILNLAPDFFPFIVSGEKFPSIK